MQAGKKCLWTFGIDWPRASMPKLGLARRRSLSTKHPRREDKHAQTGPIWRRPFQKLVPGATFNINIMTKNLHSQSYFLPQAANTPPYKLLWLSKLEPATLSTAESSANSHFFRIFQIYFRYILQNISDTGSFLNKNATHHLLQN